MYDYLLFEYFDELIWIVIYGIIKIEDLYCMDYEFVIGGYCLLNVYGVIMWKFSIDCGECDIWLNLYVIYW